MVYLLLGQDIQAKNSKLKAIKQESLRPGTEQFNLDVLYAKELALKDLQEKLLSLPVKSPRRIVVIKDAQNLKQELKDFILDYVKKPYKQVDLVLDTDQQIKAKEFISSLQGSVNVFHTKEVRQPDTFDLGRSINSGRTDAALRLLNQLLKDGQRPEMILGGLRYCLQRDAVSSQEMRRRIKLLLDCDIDIKTGRLKALFALEKLIIGLCGPAKPFH